MSCSLISVCGSKRKICHMNVSWGTTTHGRGREVWVQCPGFWLQGEFCSVGREEWCTWMKPLVCCCRCMKQHEAWCLKDRRWFTVVQSCTKLCHAAASMQLVNLTREHMQLRGEMFQWLNPFPRVVFAGITSTKLYYEANRVDYVLQLK